mmetsp:Transcript_4812/g.3425  ORF Transcript_4812/g.3425 Transcript_4812/m.3425 type:complete len:104 (+) Transcript_4812:48-359(+)
MLRALTGASHFMRTRLLPHTCSGNFFNHPIASFHSTVFALGKLKTKKAAAKRFILTGKGDLKYGRAGKRHLNKNKPRERIRRLNEMGILDGIWAKKMKLLLPN